MAKIPLRVYTKEIESLIEQGEIEQAISHAKNILKTYPKYIDAYRLLGKAFLESQRYAEAADILQRVLSVIPDDFVSQVGMSIIREDENNLDAAIWHMERAYEVQPFNPAVQDELRRLYGRRDGVEPPKIRLTRGALIRMYTRGELYPQAIAEARAALAEDPQRVDLQVLLARLYFISGHKSDAAAICSELISKLPYCLEANRLLVEILPDTTRADEARKFQQRIYALDPYEAFISPTAPTSDRVPDQAIMIEPIAQATSQAPTWAQTIGVQWDESEEEEAIPDWLNTLEPDQSSVETAPAANPADNSAFPEEAPGETSSLDQTSQTPEATQEDLVPDWMKEAGWSKADRGADEIMAEQEENQTNEEIAPAEIPDWLKSIAPHEGKAGPTPNESDSIWLDQLTSSEDQNGQPPEAPASLWSAETGEEAPETGPETESQEEETPFEQSEEGTYPVPEDNLPDWLSQLAEEEPPVKSASEETLPINNEEENPPEWFQNNDQASEQSSDLEPESPEWLKSLEAETTQSPAPTDDQMDWLSSLSEEAGAENEPEANVDWLKGIESPSIESPSNEVESPETNFQAINLTQSGEEEPPLEPSPSATAAQTEPAESLSTPPDLSDTDAMMAWLESLAAKQGADESTLITPPEQRTETPPDWVLKEVENAESGQETGLEAESPTSIEESPSSQAGLAADQPVEPISENTGAPISAEEETIPFNLNDDDASMAWIEALAAGHGLGEVAEHGSTDQESYLPEAATEEAQESSEPVAEGEESQIIDQGYSEPAVNPDEVPPEIYSEPVNISSSEEPTQPVRISPESEKPVEQVSEPEPSAAMPAEPDYNDTEAMMAWLESLAARQGADEATLITPPEQRRENPPEWVAKEMEAEGEEEAAPQPPEVSAPEENQAIAEEITSEEIPPWLKEIEEENEVEAPTSQPEPTSSPDVFRTAWTPEVEAESQPSEEAPQSEVLQSQPDLEELQKALQHGDIEKALSGYNQHIHNGEHLDEVIQSLRDALYRYPVDISIWQTLGDAYAQNNQLQEALDAYTKAEELLK